MSDTLLFAGDAANGTAQAVCSAIKAATSNPVQVEPVMARLTKRQGINDGQPRFTLRVDDQIYVFGVDDVYAHGQRDTIRRANNEERYGGPDYLMLIKVLLIQAFAAYRGGERIKPTVILSMPIEQYNSPKLVQSVKDAVCSIASIEDREGCILRLTLEPKKVLIIPESAGALSHYAFDEKSLNPRKDSSTIGTTAVVDIGFLTTNVSLFEGTAYQKDRAFTIPRGGFSCVIEEIQQHVKPQGRALEISRLDRAVRAAAGIPMKKEKFIDVGSGQKVNIQTVYDVAVCDLASRVAANTLNGIKENISRVLITGGGAYHLETILRDAFPAEVEVSRVPTPELANVLGAFTMLRQAAAKAGKFVAD